MQQKLVILLWAISLLLAGTLHTMVNTDLVAVNKKSSCSESSSSPAKTCNTNSNCSPCTSAYIVEECNHDDWISLFPIGTRLRVAVIDHYRVDYYQRIWQPPDFSSIFL